MNMIEHHILEIHSEEDVTKMFEEKLGFPPKEPLLDVELTYDCYGQVVREKRYFFQTEWEVAKLRKVF